MSECHIAFNINIKDLAKTKAALKSHYADIQYQDGDEDVYIDLGYCSSSLLDDLVPMLAQAGVETTISATAFCDEGEEDRSIDIKQINGAWCCQNLNLSEKATLRICREVIDMIQAKTGPEDIANKLLQQINELEQYNPVV